MDPNFPIGNVWNKTPVKTNSLRYSTLLILPARFRVEEEHQKAIERWTFKWLVDISEPVDLGVAGNTWTLGVPRLPDSFFKWSNLVDAFLELLKDPILTSADTWTGSMTFVKGGIDRSSTFSYLQDPDQEWFFEIVESHDYINSYGVGRSDRRVQFLAPDRDQEDIE